MPRPNKNRLFLGLDQGSSSTKCCLINTNAEVVFENSIAVSQKQLDSYSIEQNCVELLESIKNVFSSAKDFAKTNQYSIDAIGLACQRSGVCAWDAQTGKILHNLIPWSDLRTQTHIDQLLNKAEKISAKTGLPLSAHYAAGKISLLQKQFPDKSVLIGTLDSYLINRISDKKIFNTEDSMAARTLLYELAKQNWSRELCQDFNVKQNRLPQITASISKIAEIEGIPLCAMLGDQQAALFAVYQAGNKVILNLGSIASLAVVTGEKIIKQKGFLSAVFYSSQIENIQKCHYMLEAITSSCGAVIKYILNDLKLARDVKHINEICFDSNNKIISATAIFAPRGTATPDWKNYLALQKIDCDNPKDLVRALIENIGNLIIRNIETLKTIVPEAFATEELVVSGGVSEISYLLQYLADCTGLKLMRLDMPQATAQGAALAAASLGKLNISIAKSNGEIFVSKDKQSIVRYQKWLDLYLSKKDNN